MIHLLGQQFSIWLVFAIIILVVIFKTLLKMYIKYVVKNISKRRKANNMVEEIVDDEVDLQSDPIIFRVTNTGEMGVAQSLSDLPKDLNIIILPLTYGK